MTGENDFHAALDADPDDHHTRLVFADWLQERDDPRAEGCRALGVLHKRPRPDAGEIQLDRRFFTWFDLARQRESPYHPMSLPSDWFALLEGGEQLTDDGEPSDPSTRGDWLDFKTRRDAEDAATRAFAELPLARRTELLTQNAGM